VSRETSAPPTAAAPRAGEAERPGSRDEGFAGNLGALRHPLYRRYWLGSLGSVSGTQFVTLAAGWLVVFELGGSPLDLGYIGGATAVPTIVVNLFGGVLADRMDRRRLLIATSVVTALLLALLAALDATGAVEIWHVVAISAALGLVYGVDWPVRNAFFPQLIEAEQMISAVALNSVMWQATRIVSPAIGGVAIAVFGTEVVFAAGAIGFAAMLVVLLTLDVAAAPPVARRDVLGELVEGVAFIARTRLFAALILLTYATTFFGFAYVFLMPLMAAELEVGSASLGFLYSMLGIGSVSGTLLSFRLQRAPLGGVMLGASLASSVFILAFAASPFYLLSVAMVFGGGLTNSIFFITSMTAMQLRVPDALRGRVMGIHSITFSMIALGGLLGGAVANVSDVRVAVALGALLLAASTLSVALTQPEVRGLSAHAAARVNP
jgi:MFS family permease